ncbi:MULTISPECIES: hypothetical protein [Streptomycetaceae]|uniref:hypothetical protein n=1 Tax=Streptomycetaceae TaxID=2062 RepID=UPI003009FEC2
MNVRRRTAVRTAVRATARTAPGAARSTPAARLPVPAAALPAAVLLLTAFLTTACQGAAARALDCAKTAAAIAGDIQDLQSTATNVGQVSDAGRRKDTVSALDKVQKDLNRLGSGHGSDVGHAASDLSTSVRHARTTAAGGHDPDLRPVASAAGRLTVVCAKG